MNVHDIRISEITAQYLDTCTNWKSWTGMCSFGIYLYGATLDLHQEQNALFAA